MTGLRVALVLPSGLAALWHRDLLSSLNQIPGLTVQVWTTGVPQKRKTAPHGALFNKLHSRSRSRFDPFRQSPLQASVWPDNITDHTTAEGPVSDIVLWLAPDADRDRKDLKVLSRASLSKFGFLTVEIGDKASPEPLWKEAVEDKPTATVAVLWHREPFEAGRVVQTAEVSGGAGLYFTENARNSVSAAIKLLCNICVELRDRAGDWIARAESSVEVPAASLEGPAISNWTAGSFITKKLVRSLQCRIQAHSRSYSWFLAIRPNKGPSLIDNGKVGSLSGFREIPVPDDVKDTADPFLWEHEGRTWLFFEEVPKGRSKGRLGFQQVHDDGSVSERSVLLERDYHLSYPCIAAWKNDLFLLPESSGSGRVDLYRFTRFPDQLELVSSPLEGVKLVDTTPVWLDGYWYFFSSTSEPLVQTFLFWSDRLDGNWQLHPASPVSGTVRNCRAAGQLFRRNGRLYRPTQDCSERYGYGMVINEVQRLTPAEFQESAVGHVGPDWRRDLLGTHTWAESTRFQVLDGLDLRRL